MKFTWKTIVSTLALVFLVLSPTTAAAADAGGVHLRNITLDPTAVGKQLGERSELIRDGHERALWILHFSAAPGRVERESMEAAGADILNYLPSDAYLLRATADAAALLAEIPGVDMIREYDPAWKIAPELDRSAGDLHLGLSFASGSQLVDRVAEVTELGGRVSGTTDSGDRSRVWVECDARLLPVFARLPGLLWIEELPLIQDRLSEVKWVAQSAVPVETPLWDRGLHGEGQVLGHLDSNFFWIDSCWFDDPEGDPIGPDHRKIVFRGDNPHSSTSEHGTHTAGILIGNGYYTQAEPADTTLRSLAYRARMASNNYYNISSGYDFYGDLQNHNSYDAHIHSNSWGTGTREYNYLCVDIDRFLRDYEDDVVMIAHINGSGFHNSPENAKNGIGVGNHWYGMLFNQYYGGGHGPTLDGRRKPDIFTMGMAVNSAQAPTIGNNFCGEYSNTGTSMATPSIAAGTALIRQYFTEGWYPSGAPVPVDAFTPSGALLRALLIQSTAEMESLPAGYPNDYEGWGRMQLDRALSFTGDDRQLQVWDRRHAEGLGTGDEDVYIVNTSGSGPDLVITLAFTDYPGAEMAAEPVVNNLDLVVIGPDGAFYGNWFDTEAGESQTGGAPDEVNMIERVIIHDPSPGNWGLYVQGTAVPMGPQGYGLCASSGFGSVPALLTSYIAEPGAGVVSLAWEISDDAVVSDFRLEAVRVEASEAREVPIEAMRDGSFRAVDRDPSLAAGGSFYYTLYYRQGDAWLLLRRETVDVDAVPPLSRLNGVYPNPVNPQTTISFTLDAPRDVSLAIYDLAGRLVKQLASGRHEQGDHDIIWKGRNARGDDVASGVYFVRFKTEGVSRSERVVLVR